MRTTIVLVLALALLTPAAHAQKAEQCPAGRTPILILGTYHMASPGLDAVNAKVDDVLAPKRQQEIAHLVEQLAAFRPTKVALEASRISTTVPRQYADYRAGKYQLTANEIDQIGYRLAAKLGHEKVWPVDYPMWMSGITPAEQHQPKPSPSQSASTGPQPESPQMKEVMAVVGKDDELLRTSTISRFLAHLNSPERYRLNHRWDVLWNLEPGQSAALYENTDHALNWYKRNLRIFTNIIEITEPNDRILLIIGAGHQAILKDLAAEHPRYCLVATVAYLRE
ncbi:MAG TPA: DUF5694 domain-containing protein [Thermoanaerobaculia bacterium]|jgi:hypothetical protein